MCTPACVQVQVAVVERNKLVGREQEWNIGRKEMKVSALAAAGYGCTYTILWRTEVSRHGRCRWTALDMKMCSLQVILQKLCQTSIALPACGAALQGFAELGFLVVLLCRCLWS